MATRIKVNMKPVNKIITRLGIDKSGDVQMQATRIVNQRLTRYMPFRSGVLATKLKFIKSPTEIEVLGPYARYQYYGKAMEGKPPKVVTDRDLNYDKTKNPQAGPFWERRMMAAEGRAVVKELQDFINRRKGGKR